MQTTIDEQIYAAEQSRTLALQTQDIGGLKAILTPDFTYVHASGRVEDKEAYLAAIASGGFRWTDFSHRETVVRPLGESALFYGFLDATKTQGTEVRRLVFRFVAVWVLAEDGGWGLSFIQNAKPAPIS